MDAGWRGFVLGMICGVACMLAVTYPICVERDALRATLEQVDDVVRLADALEIHLDEDNGLEIRWQDER